MIIGPEDNILYSIKSSEIGLRAYKSSRSSWFIKFRNARSFCDRATTFVVPLNYRPHLGYAPQVPANNPPSPAPKDGALKDDDVIDVYIPLHIDIYRRVLRYRLV